MRSLFPLFSTPLDGTKILWNEIIQKGDYVLDATCGGGYDSLALAQFLEQKGGGNLFCIDMQEEAIARTRLLLDKNFPNTSIHFLQQSHTELPSYPWKLIVYNLGYLPRGNKALTTQASTSIISVKKALALLIPGGVVCITCYPGHEEGAQEERALEAYLSSLPPQEWCITHTQWNNRHKAPSLFLIQRAIE